MSIGQGVAVAAIWAAIAALSFSGPAAVFLPILGIAAMFATMAITERGDK